tara:strand:- start:125 stop:502 length:378 start_codon:yes stop_codon:yes gene_type:complete
MAKDKLRDYHLFVLESALPFGMGIIENAQSGGFQKIMDVFKSNDPFLELQVDGETSAKKVRDKIDKIIPGLGYPVVSVDVSVEENSPDHEENDKDSLVSTLQRIDRELDQLRYYFSDSEINRDDK